MLTCICKNDHWTTQCPYKNKLSTQPDRLKEDAAKPATSSTTVEEKVKVGKYVPTSMLDGENSRDETATIRVTNLPKDVRDLDLKDLFRPFGTIARIYCIKNKSTGQFKGFAFIRFHHREDAARAIQGVDGFSYNNLILKVEWAKKEQKMVKCHICKDAHRTTQCPCKDKLGTLPDLLKEDAAKRATPSTQVEEKVKAGKYVPPHLRDGANRCGESMTSSRGRDKTATIRITNLSKDVRNSDLHDLFQPFGTVARIYLPKDKSTGHSKGFAFINFHRREDAARAIQGVNDFGYNNLILQWARLSGTN